MTTQDPKPCVASCGDFAYGKHAPHCPNASEAEASENACVEGCRWNIDPQGRNFFFHSPKCPNSPEACEDSFCDLPRDHETPHRLRKPAPEPPKPRINAAGKASECPCGDGLRPGHPFGWCGQGPEPPKQEQGEPYTMRQPSRVDLALSKLPQGQGEPVDPLPRYGIRWNGPTQAISTPMADGYWTPFHIAESRISDLKAKLAAVEAHNFDLKRRIEVLESGHGTGVNPKPQP